MSNRVVVGPLALAGVVVYFTAIHIEWLMGKKKVWTAYLSLWVF